jgi:hypothetical protein
MSPAQRVRLAVEMSDEARQITEAGVRHRHPDWDAERLRAEASAITAPTHRQQHGP